jgi:hypothetical protein
VINMQLKKINWFGLVGGILILVVLAVSIYYPWWQLIIGENLLKVNASPVNTNFGLLGTQFTVPLIWALNIGSILTFLISGIIMLIYSLMPTKSYSKDLLSFAYKKPLYSVVLCVVGLLIITLIAQAAFGISIPLTGTATIILPSNLTMGINISVLIYSAFQWPFWLAVVAAGLCITARIYHIKLSSTPKQALAETPVTPAAPTTTPETAIV